MSVQRSIRRIEKSVCEGAALFIPTDKGIPGIRDIAKWLLDLPESYLPIDRHAVIFDTGHRVGTHIGALECRKDLWVGEAIWINEDEVLLTRLKQRLFGEEEGQ